MKPGPPCALLWRILTWCTRKQVTLKTIHSQLNVIADKLSRLGQTIQTEWSLHQEVFKQCAPDGTNCKWTCLSPGSTSYISLSHRFQSPRPGQWMPSVYLGGGSGTICLSNGNHLGQVVEKLQDYRTTVILIAPGWPNMLWFW